MSEIVGSLPSINRFLIYDDSQSGASSTDFNTVLYSNIEQNKDDFTVNGGTANSGATPKRAKKKRR